MNQPYNINPHLELAQKFLSANAFVEAERIASAYFSLHSNDMSAFFLIADIYEKQRDFKRLLSFLNEHLSIFNQRIEFKFRLVKAYRGLNQYLDELRILKSISDLDISNTKHQVVLANALAKYGFNDDALVIFDRLSLVENENIPFLLDYGAILTAVGERDKAISIFKQAIKQNSDCCPAYWNLSNIKSFSFDDHEIDAMIKLDQRDQNGPTDSMHLCFALGKAYEDKQQFDLSFLYIERANNIHRGRSQYNLDQNVADFLAFQSLLTKKALSDLLVGGFEDEAPIFILGMHRSGSTLVEQILASHSQVDGTRELPNIINMANELKDQNSHLSSESSRYPLKLLSLSNDKRNELGKRFIDETLVYRSDRKYFIDKMPENFRHIGLILSILPKAKVIDVRRHPMSVGLSIYRQLLSDKLSYTNNLSDLGHFYRHYVLTIRHWEEVYPGRIHRVQYEHLIDNTEHEVKQLFKYLELPFEKECLEFYKNKRAVKTPSAEQVRQPIYNDSVEQWKNYEHLLGPLKDGLGDILHTFDDKPF